MKWYKHDTDASSDLKIEKLMMRYGLEGYGLYFYCLERIAGNIDAHNLTFELEHDAEIIGHRVGKSTEVIQDMMTYMCNLGLFENSGGTITCLKLAKRLDQSMTSNPKLRQRIKHINDIIPDKIFGDNHDGVMTQSSNSHDLVMQEEKRIEKKRVGGKLKRFSPPTIEEIKSYSKEKAFSIDAEDFFDFYESKGWMVGKNKMKCWKSAASRWARSNKDKNTKQEVHNAI